LLVILFLLTLVSMSVVGWFGWRLIQQDAIVDRQYARERLEQAADRTVVNLRAILREEPNFKLGPVFLVTPTSLIAEPPARLFYLPFPSADPEAPAATFAEGESLEFTQGQPESATTWYRRLAATQDPATRAGALLRLARTLRKSGRERDAVAVYKQLETMEGVQVAGTPAAIVAREALHELSKDDLLSGRWPLTRGQFEFYWSRVVPDDPPPAMPPDLEQAALLAWNERSRQADRGRATVWTNGHPSFLIWRDTAEGRILQVTTPAAILRSASSESTAITAIDSDGRIVAGSKTGIPRAAVRSASESQLPWALYVTQSNSGRNSAVLARQRYLLFAMVVMFAFLAAGTYFIARAIRHEIAVARLQSDFVSAVSHEFRSPLTSIRQLSEILALGRLPHEDRRHLYYRTLVSETERLQRLVEKLLNFGGMEAGKRQYHFEAVDAADLVENVTAEFEGQIAGSGRLIELHRAATRCCIEADREALSIALRNVVDNALKYSPEQPTVWVEWERENNSVAIRVRDQGPGIPACERKAIFHKFVRGSAATKAGVKGMGVGLAMVRHIMTAHGGEILVASEPGRGSTFTLLLPAMKEA